MQLITGKSCAYGLEKTPRPLGQESVGMDK